MLRYQPVVALATGAVEELRAMLRWPGGGGITPEQLIDIARYAGVLPELHRWILCTACRGGRPLAARGRRRRRRRDPRRRPARGRHRRRRRGRRPGASGLPPGPCTSVCPLPSPRCATRGPAGRGPLGRLGVSIGVVGVRSWPLPPGLRSPATWRGWGSTASWSDCWRSCRPPASPWPPWWPWSPSTGRGRSPPGVETDRELSCVEALGVSHALGYRFAPPTPASELPRRCCPDGSGGDGGSMGGFDEGHSGVSYVGR